MRGSPLRSSHVLVVDDEELYRRALERIIARAGHDVTTARDAGEALRIASSEDVDLVLCDVKMPGISGLELVRQLHEIQPDLPCIVITGYGGPQSSIEALRAGAFWYLEKPFEQDHLGVIRALVDQAIEHGRLKSENRSLHTQLRSRYKFESIVGKSGALQRVLEIVEKVADTDSTVLITGESGTGKELIARALHYNSSRANRPLITVNCGAIPEELLESELFGHVKGAFTNAIHDRQGRFAAADGGTIFLDEIGDMSPTLQVKLLRVLQERSFEAVGTSTTVEVNVRVIAATNQNLPVMIEERRFRQDLYFRLNVLPIEMPSLRDRRDDVPLLVHHFLDASRERQKLVDSISDEAMERMVDYDWPGNVRELENMIERMVVLRGAGELTVVDLPEHLQDPPAPVTLAPRLSATGISFNDEVDQFERDLILQALERTHWNKNKAAQLLGLNRTTLVEKIRKKGLKPASEL
jgi:DNA-binding NtrC family response regulator